jgi:hypothetical protein
MRENNDFSRNNMSVLSAFIIFMRRTDDAGADDSGADGAGAEDP